ncbi:hypothetical protein A4G19_03140 [Pasteurellaceae bacterium Macca]|nr:hypothetical protein [Pasteurellaceae bacterium Macca]
MKKQLLAVIMASVFALSACEDKNLTSQVIEAEKQITQLGNDLKNSQDQLTKAQIAVSKLTAENDRLQQKLTAMGDFPALQVKIEPIFSQLKTLKFKSTADQDNPETDIGIFASRAVTGVEWLDQLLLNKLMMSHVVPESSKKSFTLDEAKKFFENEFIELEKGANEEEYKPSALNFSHEMNYLGQRNNIVVFSLSNSNYTGGAHGSYDTSYYNIDVTKKSVIGLNDLFMPEKINTLKETLWNKYVQDYSNGNAQEAWVNKEDFRISEQFYFNLVSGDITFVYPVYELGPYAIGEVEISVSSFDLQKLMKPEYRQTAERDGVGLNPINGI